MCNLYSMTKGQQAIREWAGVMTDTTGNLPAFPGIFPDYPAPIVRNQPNGRELAMARWGMPTAPFVLLKGKPNGTDLRSVRDPGTTNIRNTQLLHWRQWVGVGNRCVVPATSFSEPEGERGPPVWFALNESRPLFGFAGICVSHWTSIRKVKEGPTTNDLFGILTTEPNKLVGSYHPKAMPAILTTCEEIEIWMTAPIEEALKLPRPLTDDALMIVARGDKMDEGGLSALDLLF